MSLHPSSPSLSSPRFLPYDAYIDDPDPEIDNIMRALMAVPTVRRGAIMPDACQAGVIPVGAIVATENAIHPGFHSADICCSMYMSVFAYNDDPKLLLDAVQRVTHFGPNVASRPLADQTPFHRLLDRFADNPFLTGLEPLALSHFGTQGDGNHFAFVGHLGSTGRLALVTHHGSRGLGAQLYKRALAVAVKHTSKVSPATPKQASWIEADSELGQQYWEALQIIRQWTKANHHIIHGATAAQTFNSIHFTIWNEHNFVFQKSDGLFYHAKGATPSYSNYAADDKGLTLIPMNMAEPILITAHANNPDHIGFAPHGAGRNMSRTKFLANHTPSLPPGIDVRAYSGKHDLSELPDAYKSASDVIRQIKSYNLANIHDQVIPYGSIMAGEMFWSR